jgi:hypothetical protein
LNLIDFTDTIFADRRLPFGEILYILDNLDKKSIKRLSKELNHKWENFNRLAREFRENLAQKNTRSTSHKRDKNRRNVIHEGFKCLKKEPQRRALKRLGRGSYKTDKPSIVTMV